VLGIFSLGYQLHSVDGVHVYIGRFRADAALPKACRRISVVSGQRDLTRDFVRNCQTPVLILPDDVPAHPYAVAMEAAMLAPKAEVSMFPWKEPKERIPLAVRQICSFLRAHRSAFAATAVPPQP
jgi:hypothetical protein